MSELSTRTALDGVMNGYEFVDHQYAKKSAREANAQGMKAQQEQQAFDNDHKRSALEETVRHNKATESEKMKGSPIERLKEKEIKRQQVERDVKNSWGRYMETFEVDEELQAEAEQYGLKRMTPRYWEDEKAVASNLKLGKIIKDIQEGNFDAVNSPESLKILNETHAEEIKRGVGEFVSASGRTIVDKEIAGFKLIEDPATKENRVSLVMRVKLDDGTEYMAPRTANASAGKDDLITLNNPKTMLNDLMGRYQMARAASQKEYREAVRKRHDSLYPSDGGDLSNTGKTVRDMKDIGFSDTDIRSYLLEAKFNPQQAAANMAGDILQNPANKLSASEAYQEAVKAISNAQQNEGNGATQNGAPQTGGTKALPEDGQTQPPAQPSQSNASPALDAKVESILAQLRQNPNNDKLTDDQLRQSIKQRLNATQ